jgi:hypothetical protein
MSDAPTNPPDPRPRTNIEYEDPHYHGEELDIQSDDGPRMARLPAKNMQPRKLPRLPRRHYED